MKRGRAISLAIRLVATFALIVAATLVVAGALVRDRTNDYLDREIDARLAAMVAAFEEGPAGNAQTAADLSRQARDWLFSVPLPDNTVAAVGTVDRQYVWTPQARDLLRRAPGGMALLDYRSERSKWRVLGSGSQSTRALAVPRTDAEHHQIGTLVVAASRMRAVDTSRALAAEINRANIIGLIAAMLLGFASIRLMLRPLGGMIRQVESIQATGDLSRRVGRRRSRDEVGRLAVAFDGMLARLEEAFQNQQRFLSDASHELRTPLTVARGRLELLQGQIRGTDTQRLAAAAVEELDRMSTIVEELLLLARLDEGIRLRAEPVELELVMREAVLRSMQIAQRELVVDVEPGLFVMADADRLLQILSNLVANAIHHAGEDATITLWARQRGSQVLINVADNGKGIPPEELPHVFDRLYRGSRARTGAPGGAGLGLAIAKSLAKAMGGDLNVRSVLNQGTTFTIRLPYTPAPRCPTDSQPPPDDTPADRERTMDRKSS